MKILTLWQPWASAIAVGAKRIETRSWSTNYRGPIAIHAAKRKNIGELIHFGSCWNWCGALGRDFGSPTLDETLPFGAIVAVADLVDCRPSDDFRQGELDAPRTPDREYADHYAWTERQMGDFALGRYGWVLENVRAITPAIPWVGGQGLRDLPEGAVLEALNA